MNDGLDIQTMHRFALALLIGALVGIDREKKKSRGDGTVIGGIRTFILIAEAGAISAWLATQYHTPWIFIATLACVAALAVVGFVGHTRQNPGSIGITTEVAAVTVCLLGGASMTEYSAIAVILAVATSATLAFKEPIHEVVDKLGMDDIYAGIKLLIATFIVLPLLPKTPVDPWGALVPAKLWWLVILISTLSLVGYVATRLFGRERGLAIAGLSGGLVSSTAVTLSFARQSKATGHLAGGAALVVGILLAWAVMFGRLVLEVAVVHAPLVPAVAAPFFAMLLVTGLYSAVLYRTKGRSEPPAFELSGGAEPPLKNPFSLTEAAKFAAFFAFILLIIEISRRSLPEAGLYIVAALAGLTDVDAMTLSMAEYARKGGTETTATTAIVIVAFSNTVVKCIMAASLGDATLRRHIIRATVLILAAGSLVVWIN